MAKKLPTYYSPLVKANWEHTKIAGGSRTKTEVRHNFQSLERGQRELYPGEVDSIHELDILENVTNKSKRIDRPGWTSTNGYMKKAGASAMATIRDAYGKSRGGLPRHVTKEAFNQAVNTLSVPLARPGEYSVYARGMTVDDAFLRKLSNIGYDGTLGGTELHDMLFRNKASPSISSVHQQAAIYATIGSLKNNATNPVLIEFCVMGETKDFYAGVGVTVPYTDSGMTHHEFRLSDKNTVAVGAVKKVSLKQFCELTKQNYDSVYARMGYPRKDVTIVQIVCAGAPRHHAATQREKNKKSNQLLTQSFSTMQPYFSHKLAEFAHEEAILKAAKDGDLPALKSLLDQKGSDKKLGIGIVFTATHPISAPNFAAMSGNLDMVEMFVASGADINDMLDHAMVAQQRLTNRMNGSSYQFEEELLLSGLSNRNALSFLPAVIDRLLSHGAEPSVNSFRIFPDLAQIAPKLLLERMLANGCDIDCEQIHRHASYTALSMAVDRMNPEAVDFLISHGANPYLNDFEVPLINVASGNIHTYGSTPEKLQLLTQLENYCAALDHFHIAIGTHPNTYPLDNAFLKSVVNTPNQHGETPLQIALRAKNPAAACKLIELGADPKKFGSSDSGKHVVPLLMALENRFDDVFLAMLDKGMDVNKRIGYLSTPLEIMLQKSDEKAVALLLEHGAEPMDTNFSGQTCLRTARDYALHGGANAKGCLAVLKHHFTSFETRKDLLDLPVELKNVVSRKNVNQRDQHGRTLLSHAVEGGYSETIPLLLELGANPRLLDSESLRSPLMQAIFHRQNACLKLLLDAGADIEEKSRFGSPVLTTAIGTGNVDAVKILLQHGADTVGDDALQRTIALGDIDMTRVLLEHDVDPNQVAADGKTPIHSAIFAKNKKLVELLLAHGASPNQTQVLARATTALQFAIENDSEIAKLLIEKGADPHQGVNSRAQTPLEQAVRARNPALVSALLRRGATEQGAETNDFNLFIHAVLNGDFEIADLLHQHGVYPDYPRNSQKDSLLLGAAADNDVKLVEYLLQKDLPANLRTGWGGETALHYACQNGNVRMVNLLLSKGAQVNLFNSQNQTPLVKAVEQGHSHLVAKLIQAGARFDEIDSNGMSLLQRAGQAGQLETFQLLLAAGAPIGKIDSKFLKSLSPELRRMLNNQGNIEPVEQGGKKFSFNMLSRGAAKNATELSFSPQVSALFKKFSELRKKQPISAAIQQAVINSFKQQYLTDAFATNNPDKLRLIMPEVDFFIAFLKENGKEDMPLLVLSIKRELLKLAFKIHPDKIADVVTAFGRIPHFAGKSELLIDIATDEMRKDVKSFYNISNNNPANNVRRILGRDISSMNQGEVILHTLHLTKLEQPVSPLHLQELIRWTMRSSPRYAARLSAPMVMNQLATMTYKEAIPLVLGLCPVETRDLNARNFHPSSKLLEMATGFVYHPNYETVSHFLDPKSAYSFEQFSANMIEKYVKAKQAGQLEAYFKGAFSGTDPCYEATAQAQMDYGNDAPVVFKYVQPNWNPRLTNEENLMGQLAWMESEFLEDYAKQKRINLPALSSGEVGMMQSSLEYARYLSNNETRFTAFLQRAVGQHLPPEELTLAARQHLQEGLENAV